jgi:hypothetical protein
MGYKRNRKIYHLVWADGEYEGLEVNVRTLNIGQLIEAKTGKGVNGKDGLEGNVELLASLIVDWNLEDEVTGEPVPATLEAMKNEDDDLILAIISRWMEAVSGVAAPLDTPSPSGEISQVASIPTEALSPSLAS